MRDLALDAARVLLPENRTMTCGSCGSARYYPTLVGVSRRYEFSRCADCGTLARRRRSDVEMRDAIRRRCWHAWH